MSFSARSALGTAKENHHPNHFHIHILFAPKWKFNFWPPLLQMRPLYLPIQMIFLTHFHTDVISPIRSMEMRRCRGMRYFFPICVTESIGVVLWIADKAVNNESVPGPDQWHTERRAQRAFFFLKWRAGLLSDPGSESVFLFSESRGWKYRKEWIDIYLAW